MSGGHRATAAEVVEALRSTGRTVATAESLTGGLLCAVLIDVPGASAVVRGGVVAYAADLKAALLGVDHHHLEAYGTVDAGTARQMALGAATRCDASYGISTTGVAGPTPSEGKPVGTAFVAVARSGSAGDVVVEELALSGDREAIRQGTVAAALTLLLTTVQQDGQA